MASTSKTRSNANWSKNKSPQSPQEFRGLSPTRIYGRDVQAVAQELRVNMELGLTSAEAENRLETYGPNKLTEAKKDSPLVMFLRQFVNPLLIILLVGAVISGYTGH